MSLTPASLLARIRNMTGEDDTFWTDGEVFAYMTEAEQIVTDRVRCNQDSTNISTVANQRTYDVPGNVKEIKRVEYDGQKIKNIDFNELNALEYTSGDSSSVGDPRYYYLWGDKLGTSPVAGNDGTNISIYFTTETGTDYSSTTPSFNTPSYIAHYYADYCLFRMYMKDDELKKMASTFEARWERDIDNIESNWLDRQQGDQYTTVKLEGEVQPSSSLGMI